MLSEEMKNSILGTASKKLDPIFDYKSFTSSMSTPAVMDQQPTSSLSDKMKDKISGNKKLTGILSPYDIQNLPPVGVQEKWLGRKRLTYPEFYKKETSYPRNVPSADVPDDYYDYLQWWRTQGGTQLLYDNTLASNISSLSDKMKNAITGEKERMLRTPITQATKHIIQETERNLFKPLRRLEEKVGEYEVPFLPKTSEARYYPGQLGKVAGEFTLPQNIAEAGLFALPFGTIGKGLSKLPVGKTIAKVAKTEIKSFPSIFAGFKDLTTKVLERLKGKSTISRQFISDMTNMPELKQAERNVIRNVLDSYGGKAEKEIITSTREVDKIARDLTGYEKVTSYGGAVTKLGRMDKSKYDFAKTLVENLGPQEGKDAYRAIGLYQGSFYGRMNNSLRVGLLPRSAPFIDKAIEYGPKNSQNIVYRGIDKTFFETLKPGQVFTDKAFVSTTIDKEVAKNFIPTTKGGMMIIKNVEGQGIILPASISGKIEVLLPRNSSFKIISIKDGIIEVEMQSKKAISISDQIPVQEFANKVKSELLPLKMRTSRPLSKTSVEARVFEERGFGYGRFRPTERAIRESELSAKYESITLPDDLRGNVANYGEHIWESPVKTSAGEIHFGGASKNYFGHTRIEDMTEEGSSILVKTKGGLDVYKPKIGSEWKQGTTRRVIEVQSDLYQKGALERELTQGLSPKELKIVQTPEKGTVAALPEVQAKLKAIETAKKLQQYNDPTAHFRMVREEVKQAAIDGKTKLQFPTGETAMKIEGLGETAKWYDFDIRRTTRGGVGLLTQENIKIGKEISQRGQDFMPSDKWIITDILGEGKFKAVSKKNFDIRIKEWGDKLKDFQVGGRSSFQTEAFDISGKIDTSNPIYRFYEKDIGKYLKNKFGATLIKDDKGVSWWQLDIKPEMGKAPIEAFGAMAGIQIDDEGNVSFSPEKAMIGVGAMATGKKLKLFDKTKGLQENIQAKKALKTMTETEKNELFKIMSSPIKRLFKK